MVGLTGRPRLTELFGRAPARLSIAIAALSAILLVVVGIAVFASPTQCLPGVSGSWGCLSAAPVAPTRPAKLTMESTPSGVTASKPATVVASAAPPPKKPASSAPSRKLIDSTFAQLPLFDTKPTGPTPPALAAIASTAPTTRVVATTVVHGNAVPEALDSVSAYADPGPGQPATGDTQAAAARAPSPMPAPQGRPAAAPTAVASTDGAAMQVGGGGVTVRSAPSRNGSALFNLAAGEKVTVTGHQHGWAQIRDARGRTGWAYENLLRHS